MISSVFFLLQKIKFLLSLLVFHFLFMDTLADQASEELAEQLSVNNLTSYTVNK